MDFTSRINWLALIGLLPLYFLSVICHFIDNEIFHDISVWVRIQTFFINYKIFFLWLFYSTFILLPFVFTAFWLKEQYRKIIQFYICFMMLACLYVGFKNFNEVGYGILFGLGCCYSSLQISISLLKRKIMIHTGEHE